MEVHVSLVHFSAAGVGLVIDCAGPGLPRIRHWGAALGDLSGAELADLVTAGVPHLVSNGLDQVVPVAILPEQSAGWLGTPGLSGHRDGVDFSAAFTVDGVGPYTVDSLLPTLPVPPHAGELLDLTGRHLRERSPQRALFTIGTHVREGRRGRTGTDASLILAAGAAGFGFATGDVWTVHVAWSGNHRTFAERTPTGDALLGGGELLLPGEGRIAPGESYATPW